MNENDEREAAAVRKPPPQTFWLSSLALLLSGSVALCYFLVLAFPYPFFLRLLDSSPFQVFWFSVLPFPIVLLAGIARFLAGKSHWREGESRTEVELWIVSMALFLAIAVLIVAGGIWLTSFFATPQ